MDNLINLMNLRVKGCSRLNRLWSKGSKTNTPFNRNDVCRVRFFARESQGVGAEIGSDTDNVRGDTGRQDRY